MVTTRLSTGKLPPKRKDAMNSLSESDEEEELVQPPKKRPRLDDDEYCDLAEPIDNRPKRISRKKERTGASLITMPPKLKRTEGLLTGPASKALWKPTVKKDVKVSKSRLGKLAGIMDLPVDVFCEIASHLTILDILNISRASRSIRDLLMSKASRTIWLASIAEMGIPACPDDLNEPQYANLFFEKFCHGCGYKRVERVDLTLRIRLCKGCSKLNILRGSTIAKQEFGTKAAKRYEIYTLVPWRHMSMWDILDAPTPKLTQRYYLRSEFVHIMRQYLSIEPETEEMKIFINERHRILRESLTHKAEMEAWRFRKREEKRETEQERFERRALLRNEKIRRRMDSY